MTQHDSGGSGWFRSRTGIALLGFLGIAAFFLVTEHRAHLWGTLPYMFLLACPLLHLLMHKGHGRQGGHEGDSAADTVSHSHPSKGERT